MIQAATVCYPVTALRQIPAAAVTLEGRCVHAYVEITRNGVPWNLTGQVCQPEHGAPAGRCDPEARGDVITYTCTSPHARHGVSDLPDLVSAPAAIISQALTECCSVHR